MEFAINTQALRVVKSVCKSSSLGNCQRGPVDLANMDEQKGDVFQESTVCVVE